MVLFRSKQKANSRRTQQQVGLITVNQPTSQLTERFRTLRANIQFASANQPLKTLVFTSAKPAAGKSTISANIAVTWADQGEKVLLIDANLRQANIHRMFNIANDSGLTTILTAQKANLNDYIQKTSVDNLYVLPSGPLPINPSELLGSTRLNQLLQVLERKFDMIIFDTTSVKLIADARILASKADGVILVVSQNYASKEAVIQARNALNRAHAKLLGAVMNRVSVEEAGN
ncbi:CpsD/CapB family tyrosine-protein kinase [Loigolactobacillus rennini]|uniref:Tyrosine-protein kinase CpsD n=2 Tax=Loigolactobacillus rennini TaxID=238013 RepID=A0A0R2CS56_9LACO|nr:CpsD/CapB family tyrosine-protein kinase [Loigolactobacillus rennini]KRM94623.1 tyrosine-protein kinase [Loigolactobacillus rennini DSM 20253]SFZ89110.1 Tyrosine-protein kinase EpsD [Loigolactobacillus rennini]